MVCHRVCGVDDAVCVSRRLSTNPPSFELMIAVRSYSTFASSVPSEIIPPLMSEFGFGQEAGTLLISLFVAGYCVGPLLWGPLSEQYGRGIIGIVTFSLYTAFQVGCALSTNTASILIFRFLGGTFAASPLTNSGYVGSSVLPCGSGPGIDFFRHFSVE